MDGSKPYRRLLPAGVLSVAGLAGCVTAPAYRPVIPQAPPPAASASNPAPGSPSAASPVPAAPATPPAAAPPAAPPADSPPRFAMPPAPPQSSADAAPSAGPELNPPSANGADLHLSAPMGVLQTPLPAPPQPITVPGDSSPAQPATQVPAGGNPAGQAAVSVSVDAGETATPDQPKKPPKKKPKPAKPADPPMSPLARLRQRFHMLTHPSEKQAPQKEPETTTHATHLVTGSRVPLPTAGATMTVQAAPLHPLYAADDAQNGPPPAASMQTARIEPTPAPPSSASAAMQPSANSEIEQWSSHRTPAASTTQRTPQTAESPDEFTAISDEEYRATVAKIARSNEPTATTETPAPPAIGPPKSQDQARSTLPATPQSAAPAVGSNVPAVPGQAQTWIVIPQRKIDRSGPPFGPSGGGSNLAASAPATDTVRDLAVGAPSSAAWVPPASPGPTIAPASSTSAGSSPTAPIPTATFTPGWSQPPATLEAPPASSAASP